MKTKITVELVVEGVTTDQATRAVDEVLDAGDFQEAVNAWLEDHHGGRGIVTSAKTTRVEKG